MLIPITELPNLEGVDVCVIGGGAAGITIARKLGAQGRKVVLCEGGTVEYTDDSQKLYIGTVKGDDYFPLDVTRLRYLGGSTNHWAGVCRPLDVEDFVPKPASPNTGWPIARTDINPYLEEAFDILEIQPIPDDRMVSDAQLKKVYFFTTDQPVRFTEKYLSELERSQNILLCLNANLISMDADDNRVLSATFATIDLTQQRKLTAKDFVLATGGIENSRLLLWMNEIANGRIVKQADALGRYWAEHPNVPVADAVASRDANLAVGDEERIYFAPTEQAMHEKGILNCRLALSLETMKISRSKRIINELACVAPAMGKWAYDLLGKQLLCGIRIRASWEQEPLPENRITLSTDRDPLQIPRLVLHWKKSALDLRTCRETVLMFANWFATSNKGRVRIADWLLNETPWPEDTSAGHHHFGGTRMADNARTGVVDLNQQVFGTANLFVAGSSVFPNAGYANPTLTIVQLSLRLAAYLNNKNQS